MKASNEKLLGAKQFVFSRARLVRKVNFPDIFFSPLESETCVLLKHISQIHDSFIEMIED